MKYTPLNLSFLQNQYSPQQDSIRNTAQMIMANAGWSKPSQATLKEIAAANAKAKKEYNSEHKQSFLSSIFDQLSTPLYSVANALDEALAAHQGDSSDSVITDIGKTLEGARKGAISGWEAGARGATGILDALPGVDINDDWQSNPTNKTNFSDVAIRQLSGMSTKEAMDPKNWAAVKAKLEKAQSKGLFSKTFPELFLPGNLDAPDAQQKFIRNEMLGNLPVDIGLDPTNFIPGGGLLKGGANAAKGVTEGLDAARASEEVSPILAGLKNKAGRAFENKVPLSAETPVQALGEVNPGTVTNVANVAPQAEKGFKTLANLGRREAPEASGVLMTPRKQQGVAAQIAKWSTMMGQKNWLQRVGQYLHMVDDGVQWNKTLDFVDKAGKAVAAKGARHNPEKMVPVLLEHMRADMRAARPATQEVSGAERRVMNQVTDVGIRSGGPALKSSEAQLANKTVRKFENEILGRGRAPGTGEGLAQAIAMGRNVRYSGPQQARMWNQITSSLKYADPRKFDKAVRVLRTVENYFITKGVIPHSAAKTAESVPLRLSQVAEAIGPQFLGKSHAFITGVLRGDPKALAHLNPDQIEALNALRANEAIAAAPAVQRGIQAGKQAADVITKAPFSVARKNEATAKILRDIKTFTAAQGGGDVGAHVVGEYMGNILGKSDPINGTLRVNKLATEGWLSKAGKSVGIVANEPDFVKSVTNAISRAADLPSPKQLSGAVGAAARVTDWLGARFNAAYGVQDMRPIFLREQASAMETTARRARLINELGRRFPPSNVDLWHEAFQAAQQNGIASGQVAELQSEIAKAMENLFGGTGLRSGAIADSTVVGRNRLYMDELNKNLRRFGLGKYEFTAKKVVDAAGVEHDFSKGLDWMKSWEAWNVKDPYTFLHKVQNAIEHTVREKNMFDEIVSRFASPKRFGEVKYGVDHPRLKGFYFTAEGGAQARTFVRMLDEISTPNSKSLQYFDHVLSKIKAGLTIYGGLAGHQITNLIGDMYYNWIAGVTKPIRYEQAMKVMAAQKGRYGDFATFDKLAGPKALEQAVARSVVKPDAGLVIPAAGNKVIVTMQNGTKVTADMIYTAAFKQGILPSARVLEDVTSDVTSVLDKFKPLGGRGQRAIHQVSEVRDHIPRLAQFIDGIAKHKGSFGTAVESSARSVRKWHPDGLDLTKFERTVMKRVFPFYSWTRKAIPLAIESSIFAAPKVMAYPRLMEAIGLANGVDPNQAITDPFPTDQMFPDWLRTRGIGPIAGGPGNYTVVNPSTPVLDVLSLLGQPGQTALDMANPMGKVPIEVANNETLGRKVPINNYTDYFTQQVPILSTAGRVSGQFGVSNSTKTQGFPNVPALVNLLTGAKMVNTGPYQKSAQFDLRDYFKKKAQQQGR